MTRTPDVVYKPPSVIKEQRIDGKRLDDLERGASPGPHNPASARLTINFVRSGSVNSAEISDVYYRPRYDLVIIGFRTVTTQVNTAVSWDLCSLSDGSATQTTVAGPFSIPTGTTRFTDDYDVDQAWLLSTDLAYAIRILSGQCIGLSVHIDCGYDD